MTPELLLCTDLDRTLVPNGPQPESPAARSCFAALVDRPEVTLAYVSGRHLALVEQAIAEFDLPRPDHVIADVGVSLYEAGEQGDWVENRDWQTTIAQDWAGRNRDDIVAALSPIEALRLQEAAKQNAYKVSYYLSLDGDRAALDAAVRARIDSLGVRASLIWSVDEHNGVGLLDVLPAGANKRHAISFLIEQLGLGIDQAVFSGDSGNDLEVLVSPIPSVLVANAIAEVRDEARRLADASGTIDTLYFAEGGLFDMNGCYAAGILEGVVHYHPEVVHWLEACEPA